MRKEISMSLVLSSDTNSHIVYSLIHTLCSQYVLKEVTTKLLLVLSLWSECTREIQYQKENENKTLIQLESAQLLYGDCAVDSQHQISSENTLRENN